MAFCKYSNECVQSNSTQVDNLFISQFVPNSPDVCVKVYLFGLYKCANPNAYDNTLENFASELNMTPDDVEQAFLYWQGLGLVDIVTGISFEIRFLPIKNALNKVMKFSKSKYADFNKQAQEIIEGRMITQTEFVEYYTVMETFHIEPKALLAIMEYCTELKSKNVGYNYILTVARNWATEGITTRDAVIEKIRSYGLSNDDIAPLLKICGIKRMANIDERDKFLKWTKDFGFAKDTILFVANIIWEKSGGKVNMQKLDTKLTSYYEAKRISMEEIADFEEKKTEMFDIAKTICKKIGVYYENLEPVVDLYITKWLDLGHTANSLETLANFCFKTSIRTLDALDNLINKLYKHGIVSQDAINDYVYGIVEENAEITQIFTKLGINRNVIAKDREFFKIWKYEWQTPDELLELAIKKASEKKNPLPYMNTILSDWHAKGIKTLEQASKTISVPKAKPTTEWEKRVEEINLDDMFDDLENMK